MCVCLACSFVHLRLKGWEFLNHMHECQLVKEDSTTNLWYPYFHLVPSLKMNGAASPLSLFVSIECIEITSSFFTHLVYLKSSYKGYIMGGRNFMSLTNAKYEFLQKYWLPLINFKEPQNNALNAVRAEKHVSIQAYSLYLNREQGLGAGV